MKDIRHPSVPRDEHVDRRQLLKGLIATPFLAASSHLPIESQEKPPAPSVPSAAKGKRLLLKGGHVITLDKSIGDIAGADVLIEGSTIASVGRGLHPADAEIIDASAMVVMPGFIDSHRHTWQTVLRGYLTGGNYYKIVLEQLGPIYRPQDVYIGNLLGAIGALDCGVTTLLDWSHIINSPAHADAAVKGLQESGIRGVFAHGVAQIGRSAGANYQPNSQKHSDDIRRVQRQYFTSTDQLLTLAIAIGGIEFSSLEETINDIKLARELGIRVTTHVGVIPNVQAVTKMYQAKIMGPDITYVHATRCSEDEIKMIADTGGTLSSSPLNEPLPDVALWLKYGLRPSLSIDNETKSPSDLFTQMRAMLWHEWNLNANNHGGAPITYRDILEFATLQGAPTMGLESKVGSLAPGKRADIIMIDRDDLRTIPHTGDPAASVVSNGDPSKVRWVLVDGKVRKRDRHMVGVDLSRLSHLAQASHDYLIKTAKLPPQS
jgi:5-methylthioadenosine/S-adenosylhomocysteine deaminase